MTERALFPPFPMISPISPDSVALLLAITVASFASATHPSANRAFYYPFYLDEPYTVRRLWVVNGSVVSGNFCIGVYSAGKNGPESRLITTGSVAQAGIDTRQFVDVTDRMLFPGHYFLGFAMDNATGTTYRAAPNAALHRMAACYTQNTAFVLPATATPVAPANAVIHLAGLTSRASL